jgi:hypothetical protein
VAPGAQAEDRTTEAKPRIAERLAQAGWSTQLQTKRGLGMTTPSFTTPASEPIRSVIKRKRVLLVDTSPAKRDLRAEIMRKLGIDVDCAADIVEARSWWRADLYNLVLVNVADDLGGRNKFCADVRNATPPQQLAFLVGKPRFLADAPSAEAFLGNPESDAIPQKQVDAQPAADPYEGQPQRWGILEASRRISAVRAESHARTKVIRERPEPPRDSENRVSRRTTESRTLDQLLREEMQ